ncbi:MAG TPA: trypsin-like peptidase domain-containing protein [Terriglobales bacterium]|jgi:S1-C subfamily serine protease|nr:trypsin-like peptidase domain-containing protein [Terriglobales bacterium]
MRTLRPLIFSVFLVLGFYLLTTHGGGFHLPVDKSWVTRPAKIEITEAAAPPNFDAEEQNNISVYRRVIPTVVNITSTAVAFDFFYGAVPQQGQGSGFIIDSDGHILTNNHVIAGARQVEVTLWNKKKYRAEVIGADRQKDLAVIQIPAKSLASATLGDSKILEVGQKVYAIGNPFGLSGTMTRGIISSIRSVRGPEGAAIDQAIQTDAAINPGNSGGPLLNSRGEVIGINSMILTGGVEQSAGVGFAIPINSAKAVLNDLVQFGRVRRPSLGIAGLLPIGPELADQMGLAADAGVLVQQVVPGGAADRAGMKGGRERAYLGNTPIYIGGDLIVQIDDQDIETPQDIANVLDNHHSGDVVKITVYRGKQKLTLNVTLDEMRGTQRAT